MRDLQLSKVKNEIYLSQEQVTYAHNENIGAFDYLKLIIYYLKVIFLSFYKLFSLLFAI